MNSPNGSQTELSRLLPTALKVTNYYAPLSLSLHSSFPKTEAAAKTMQAIQIANRVFFNCKNMHSLAVIISALEKLQADPAMNAVWQVLYTAIPSILFICQ